MYLAQTAQMSSLELAHCPAVLGVPWPEQVDVVLVGEEGWGSRVLDPPEVGADAVAVMAVVNLVEPVAAS